MRYKEILKRIDIIYTQCMNSDITRHLDKLKEQVLKEIEEKKKEKTEETRRDREIPFPVELKKNKNGRMQCDTVTGLCACGAWHNENKICACGATSQISHAHWCPNSLLELNTEPYDFPKKHAPKEKSNKSDWSIFPFEEAKEVLKAFEYGVKKYGAPFTYRNGAGVPEADLLAASFRHLISIHNNEDIALDSKCLHWAHVAANALMAITTLQKRQSLTKLDND